jgi:hypothetical protein
MSFLLIPLRVFHIRYFFNVSFRAFGLESGRTSRLQPGERVLKSRSESTAYAYTPETDSEALSTPFYSSSRSISPLMSENNTNQHQDQQQANQQHSQHNVQPTFFNNPLVYPQIPQVYGGATQNPPNQPMFNAAALQNQYSQAQMLQMMQHFFRNTSLCKYVKYKNNRIEICCHKLYKKTPSFTQQQYLLASRLYI